MNARAERAVQAAADVAVGAVFWLADRLDRRLSTLTHIPTTCDDEEHR